MQVSLNWLNEFVDLSDVEVEQIAHELTMSGLEVEAIDEVKPQFTNIKTVKIEKIDNHPNSDRLHLVTVNTGSGLKTVVCGAQNIKEGQIVYLHTSLSIISTLNSSVVKSFVHSRGENFRGLLNIALNSLATPITDI